DGTSRAFDVSDPHAPKEIYTHQIGDQVNMLSQSWDGKRVYFTSSLLNNWDKREGKPGDVQYFKAFTWDGKALNQKFTIDFWAEKLGSPHQMRFGAHALYSQATPVKKLVSETR
ncbi:MAG: selenium-binding family protein, partial [Gammaproteobacteria bacterium]|nr:selenium-binding family protein [Gammaproteobacteria bacterium]